MQATSSGKKGFPFVMMSVVAICLMFLPYAEVLSLRPAFTVDAFTGHSEHIKAALLSLVAYMFQHSSFERFEDNIFYFAFAGYFLERAIGHWRFAAFVLATAVGAGVIHVLLNPDMQLGVIGLSGVTMGLLTAVALAGERVVSIPYFNWLGRGVVLVIAGLQLHSWYFGGGTAGGDSNSYSLHFGSAITGLALYVFWLRTRLALKS